MRRAPTNRPAVVGPGDERGQATVEVALALPVVAVLLLLVVQVALVVRDQVLVIHAAHEAARAAAIDDRPAAPQEAARRSGPLDPGRLRVHAGPRGQPGSLVIVDVSYTAPTDVPLAGLLVGDVELHARAAMRVEG
ncbi:MAG: hypothetical protein JWN46_3081 [Acidimicrobiales bacterium]|nr:hypothetical protein [Acidimicrobiales bacterium]